MTLEEQAAAKMREAFEIYNTPRKKYFDYTPEDVAADVAAEKAWLVARREYFHILANEKAPRRSERPNEEA